MHNLQSLSAVRWDGEYHIVILNEKAAFLQLFQKIILRNRI
jgi:hypothetical protein